MNRFKKYGLIHAVVMICMLLHYTMVNGQLSKKAYAEDYEKVFDYSNSAEMYQYLANKSIKSKNSKDKSNSTVFALKAARNYYLANAYESSVKWFDYCLNTDASVMKPAELNMYFNALLRLNKTEELRQRLVQAQEQQMADSAFIQRWMDVFDEKNYRDSVFYNVKYLEFNSRYNDFGAVIGNNTDLMYISQKRPNSSFNPQDKITNQYYQSVHVQKIKTFDKDTIVLEKSGKSYQQSKMQSVLHDGPIWFARQGNIAIVTQNVLKKKKELYKIDNNVRLYNLGIYIYEKQEKNKKTQWILRDTFPMQSGLYSYGHAVYDEGNGIMYYVSNQPGGYGGTDIWAVKYDIETKQWDTPVLLGDSINTTGNEMFLSLDSLGNLYFSSDGHSPTLGGLDVYQYQKSKRKLQHFSYPLNSHGDDFGFYPIHYASNQQFSGLLSTNRNKEAQDKTTSKKQKSPKEGSDQDDNIYYVRLRKPIQYILVHCIDSITGKLLQSTEVFWDNNKEKQRAITDTNGQVIVEPEYEENYHISSQKSGYKSLNTANVQSMSAMALLKKSQLYDTTSVTLYLRPYWINLRGLVVDKMDGKKLVGAVVEIKTSQGESYQFNTNDTGSFYVPLIPGKQYKFKIYTSGYDTLYASYDVEDVLDSDKDKREVFRLNKKYKVNDVFVLKNIYFDYGKYDLRPESFVELDKLYQFLVDNPSIKIELSAHTDSRSSFGFNLKLSHNRAKVCYEYLVKKGIDKRRIEYKGYSWLKPVNRCKRGVECSEEEHQENRRTEIKILAN